MNGLKQAAIYSYPPSRLGFCGRKFTNTAKILKNYIIGKNKSKTKVLKALSGFEAAFPYLNLIARVNKIKNPFSKKVVEALWLGNKLLENTSFKDFRNMVYANFLKLGMISETEARKRLEKLKNFKIYPHHSFHVFVFGSVTGIIFKPRMYDLCRISWGKVIKIYSKKNTIYGGSNKILVQYQPILLEKDKFYLDNEIKKEIYWKKDFVKGLKPGDWISFHWDLVCQQILEKQVQSLERYTDINLKLANKAKD